MDTKRTTNFLLLIIAICMVLLSFKQLALDIVPDAKAQATNAAPSRTLLMGCYRTSMNALCNPVEVRVSDTGALVVEINK